MFLVLTIMSFLDLIAGLPVTLGTARRGSHHQPVGPVAAGPWIKPRFLRSVQDSGICTT